LFETTRNRLGRLDCIISSCWACICARHPLSAGLVSGLGAGVAGLLVGLVRCAYPVASSKQVIIVSLVSHMLRMSVVAVEMMSVARDEAFIAVPAFVV